MDDLTKIQDAAKTLLKVYDDGICGRKVDMDAWRRMIAGSAFGAAAYEFDPDKDSAPSGMIQCLLRAIIDPTDPALDHLRACNQPAPPNPPEKPDSSDLRETTARRIYEARHEGMANVWSWDSSGLDDEHPGARDAIYRDADAAIAAVAAHLEAKAQALPMGHETPSKGCSTYNWLMHAAREIRALARKE